MGDFRDRYRLEARPLGIGGFAEVFPATDRESGKRVALKRLRADRKWGDGPARLRREIEITRGLQHRNIMPVLDYDADQHEWYAMPLGIRSAFDLGRPADEGIVAAIVTDGAGGLAFAHERGLVHRDVTPRNLIELDVDRDRRWVVADFGLVRRPLGETTNRLTDTGEGVGTAGFAAPETYDDAHRVGPQADVYGLARVAAFLLSGRIPAPNLPLLTGGRWDGWIRRCTEVNPILRFGAMRDAVGHLQEEVLREQEDDLFQLADAARQGDGASYLRLLRLLHGHLGDEDLLDEVTKLRTPEQIAVLIREGVANATLDALGGFLTGREGRQRRYEENDAPLLWMLAIARASLRDGQVTLAHQAFRWICVIAPGVDRWGIKSDVVDWLAALRGDGAQAMAAVLSEQREARDYFAANDRYSMAQADPVIRRALR